MGQNRRLGIAGLAQLVLRAFERQRLDRQLEYLLGPLVHVAGLSELLVQVGAHADELRALTGEEKTDWVTHRFTFLWG